MFLFALLTMEAKEVDSLKPNEESTIARPIRHNGPLVLTFSHRRLYYLPNFNPVFDVVNPVPVPGTTNPIFIRNQFRCLPIRANAWWMTPGEQALLYQFQKMKYVHAKWCIHNQSFRTQFVTGSANVGFANSNMQCHAYVYKGNMDNFPMYEIWYNGNKPITDNPVTGPVINSAEWPNSLDGGLASFTLSPQYQFTPLPYVPWIYGGTHRPSDLIDGVLYPELGNDTNFQNYFNMLQDCDIIGKKVPEICEEYDLASTWGNRFIPIVPRTTFNEVGIDWSTKNMANYPSMIGTKMSMLQKTAAGTGINMFGTDDDMICPPNDFSEYMNTGVDSSSGPNSGYPSSQVSGSYGGGHRKPRVQNKFLAVEHLVNDDGSIVPMVWDFYVDTEITVEVTYETGGYLMRCQNIQIPAYRKADGTPVSSGPLLNINQMQRYQSTQQGTNSNILTHLYAGTNTRALGEFTGGVVSLGTGHFGNSAPLGNTTAGIVDFGGLT